MPHITIECSGNVADVLDVQGLVEHVHTAALATGLPPKDGLRTRAIVLEHFAVAGLEPENGFVALVARIGPGRSAAEVTAFLHALMDALETFVEPSKGQLRLALSAEVQHIDPELRINHNHIRDAGGPP